MATGARPAPASRRPGAARNRGQPADGYPWHVDDATWARGRGWALSVALIALPYYEQTNPVMVANARRRVVEVLTDH